jgi:hypothetical protein
MLCNEGCSLGLIRVVLRCFSRTTHEDSPRSRRVSIPTTFGNMVNFAQLSGSERQNGNAHPAQMAQGSPPELNKFPHGAVGSQQLMTSSGSIQGQELHGTGAQFEDRQHSPDPAGLTDDIISDKDRHHRHQASVHGMRISPGILEAPEYLNLRPIERFLLETRAQQPAVFVEPSRGHPPARGGCSHRSSPSAK